MAAYLKYCAAHRKLALEQNQSGKQAFAGIGMAGSAQTAQKKSPRQPGSHAAKKAAKKAARKFAKKAAKKAARKRAFKVAQNHAAEVHDPNPT